MTTRVKTHEVVDTHTKRVVGSYTSLRRAHAAADRRDAEYGAVRYVVRLINAAGGQGDQTRAALLAAIGG